MSGGKSLDIDIRASMIPESDIAKVIEAAQKQLGKPYAIGYKDSAGRWVVRGKPSIWDADPREFDCSGYSKWVIGQTGIVLPDGCHDQIRKCNKISTAAKPLDLGFADLHGGDGEPDHVIVVEDEGTVLEARGAQAGHDYGKVIRRPRSAWEAQKGFMGWYRVPGIYD